MTTLGRGKSIRVTVRKRPIYGRCLRINARPALPVRLGTRGPIPAETLAERGRPALYESGTRRVKTQILVQMTRDEEQEMGRPDSKMFACLTFWLVILIGSTT